MNPAAEIVPAAALNLNAAMLAATQLGKEGVEVLERLHAIHKEERAANAKAAFVLAMSQFRGEMPPIVKSKPGQHGTNRVGTRTTGMYAPLDTITPVLDPIAAKHGFSYRFDREIRDGKEYIVCIVTHKDGHDESSRFPAPSDTGPGRSAIQAIASGESYAKRYALIAAFGITTADPDDDGEAAGRRESEPAESDGPVALIDEAKAANLVAMLDEAPEPAKEKAALLGWVARVTKRPVGRVSEIPADFAAKAIGAVEAKRKAGWPS